MVDTIGFANVVGGLPEYTGRQGRQLNAVAFAGASAARPLGALTGVRPGTPANTVTATSTTWSCGEFAGLADLMVAGEAGPYPFAFDGSTGGSLTPADSNNPRIDIVYTLVTDPEDGTTVPTATRLYLAGTAASTPVAPAAPTGAFTIAQITVPKVGAGSPSVTWVAPYLAAAGGVREFTTLAALKAWTPATDGALAYANDTDNLWSYVASAVTPGWFHVGGRPVLGSIGFTTIYSSSGTSPAGTSVQNGRVYLEGAFTTSAATFAAATTYTVGQITDSTLWPAAPVKFTATWGGTGLVSINIDTSGNITVLFTTAPGSVGAGALQVYLSGMSWRLKSL